MEEYENRVKYLRHLKKIADISQVVRKNNPLSTIFNHHAKSKEAITTSKCSRVRDKSETKTHTSSDRIMRNFNVDKQNHRLLSKLMGMNSSISFRKYQKQYQTSQNYPAKEYRIKRSTKHLSFKIFDINMNIQTSSNPDNHFKVYQITGKKKALIASSNLFQLRKQQLKIRKHPQTFLKIQGDGQSGLVRLNNTNLMDIVRHGQKIGSMVVEYIKK